MADLSGVKKGDFVSVVRSGFWSGPTTSTKVEVTKRTPKTLVLQHNGEEYRVDLEGRTRVHGEWVELWDDAKEQERAREAELFRAREAIRTLEGYLVALPIGTLTPEDALREPGRFAELQYLRDEFVAKMKAVAAEIQKSRV